ncbi:MAG: FAD-dependent monooxygenase [bacterium]|nr:FAD-dependent monooxygenase [bacterium]
MSRVLVAGAGIGGAACALLLARDGAEVTLLERVAEPRAVGAGILLQPNGLAVLYGLGLEASLRNVGTVLRAGAVMDAAGRPILHTTVPDFGEGLDHLLAIRRSHLQTALLDAVAAAPGITSRFGADVREASADGRVVWEEGGATRTETYDLVVGADGVHSRVRAGGRFDARTRDGLTYVRALVAPGVLDGVGEWWTPLGIFGGAPLDGATYVFASTRAPALRDALAARDVAALASHWRGVCEPAGRAFASLGDADALLVNTVRRVDCARWSDGRLVLVGDAAHAMAPNLGQGANSALVDVALLAGELRRGGDALARWEQRRRRPVRRVQDTSQRMGQLSHLRNPLARWARDNLLRVVVELAGSESAVHAAMQEDPAWLRRVVERRA